MICKAQLFLLLIVALVVAPASAQVATVLTQEGDILEANNSTVASINNSATNSVGGYAFTVTTFGAVANVWGNPTGGPGMILATEQIIGGLELTSIEFFFGMSDAGEIAYSAFTRPPGGGDTLDAAYLDNLLLLNEEDPIDNLPGRFSTFNSRPGITASGSPYWIGGIASAPGSSTETRALFFGTSVTPLLVGGDKINGIPETLDTGSLAIGIDVRFSANGTNYITDANLNTSGVEDSIVISNGAAMLAGGQIMREGVNIPASVGGIGDQYESFDFFGITESGGFMVTGDTSAVSDSDEFIMIDGAIVLREGDTINDQLLNGAIESAFMNQDGDWAAIWDADLAGVNREVLIVNGEIVLSVGDEVDDTGDGIADENVSIIQFTGINSMTLGSRDAEGNVSVYFTADITQGSMAQLQDEAAMELVVNVGSVIKGDVNGDGVVDLLDVGPFVDALSGGTFIAEADVNCDGEISLLDVGPFVELLSGG